MEFKHPSGNGVEHTTDNNVLIITPTLKILNAQQVPEFKKKVIDLITMHDSNHVVIDLHRIQSIDTSGLGSFLSVLRLLNTQGGELKFACLNKQVRTLFELVSMHKIFEIFNTTEDAVSSFKP